MTRSLAKALRGIKPRENEGHIPTVPATVPGYRKKSDFKGIPEGRISSESY